MKIYTTLLLSSQFKKSLKNYCYDDFSKTDKVHCSFQRSNTSSGGLHTNCKLIRYFFDWFCIVMYETLPWLNKTAYRWHHDTDRRRKIAKFISTTLKTKIHTLYCIVTNFIIMPPQYVIQNIRSKLSLSLW